MQGISTYIPETNCVPWEYSVAAILLLLFMVLINYYYYARRPRVTLSVVGSTGHLTRCLLGICISVILKWRCIAGNKVKCYPSHQVRGLNHWGFFLRCSKSGSTGLWCAPVAFIRTTFRENRRPGAKVEIWWYGDAARRRRNLRILRITFLEKKARGGGERAGLDFLSLLNTDCILDAFSTVFLVKEWGFYSLDVHDAQYKLLQNINC